MTIIANDDFWMVWIIQLIFDVVILFILILREPKQSRSDANHPDNWIEAPNVTQPGNPRNTIEDRPDIDRFGWERRDAG